MERFKCHQYRGFYKKGKKKEMKKTTGELLEELRQTISVDEYLTQNSGEIITESLTDVLKEMLETHNMSKAEAIKASNVNEVYGYQIFKGLKNPSRDKILTLCLGMEMTLAEAQRLLKVAGLGELYSRNRRDAVIIFCINKGTDVAATNELLDKMNEFVLE